MVDGKIPDEMQFNEPIDHEVELYDDESSDDDPVTSDSAKRFQFVIFPGNKRLGPQVEKYKRVLGGIVFVLDSTKPDISKTAEYFLIHIFILLDGCMMC